MRERPLKLESLSVSTFQLSSVQAAAVAELLRIAPVADRLGELFSNAGHELYLVGGSVRDALLGKLGHDLDFATSARPDTVEKLLRKLSSAVWTIGKEFGTIGCKVDVGDVSWVIEITTYRSDVYPGHSRKPEVAFGDTLHDGKSQSGAAGSPAIAAPEALEDQFALVVGNAGPLVEERPDASLQVLRVEQRAHDLPYPRVRSAHPLVEDRATNLRPTADAPADALFDWGRGTEIHVAREIIDIGIGRRHVARLHRQQFLSGRAPQFLLQERDHPQQLLRLAVADIVDAPRRGA